MRPTTPRPCLLAVAVLHLAVAGGCGGASDDPDAQGSDSSGGDTSTGAQDDSTITDPGVETSGSSTGSSSGADEASGDVTGAPTDTGSAIGPTLVEVTPADGATGVASDAVIVLRFSEPMDMASVQQAYQSAAIPAAAVTFEWNAAGDELTVTPNEPLPYAQGDDPNTVAASVFAYTITSVAESADGVSLESPVDVSFTTLRRIAHHLERDEALSTQMRNDGFQGIQPYIGDFTLDEGTRRYLLSFDLSSVPDIDTLEEADLHAAWTSVLGDPWISMGGVLYRQVSYDTIGPATFDGPTHTSNYALFANQNNFVTVDVSSELQSVLDDPGTFDNRLQFRLRWAIENNFDMDHDGLYVDEDLLELDLLYLTP